MTTRLDRVPPHLRAEVATVIQGLLGAHAGDLEVEVWRTPEGHWQARITSLREAEMSLLPTFDRDTVYADVADALAAMLDATLP